MPDTATVQDLVTRVAVLEAEATQYAERLDRIEQRLDNVDSSLRDQVMDLEQKVDDLRVDTALVKRVIRDLDKMAAQQDKIGDKLDALSLEWNKVKGWVAGAVAVGTAVWGVVWCFKDEILQALSHFIGK